MTDTSYGFFKLHVNRWQLVGKNSYQNKRCSSNLTAISSPKNRGPILILMSALTAENVFRDSLIAFYRQSLIL